MRDYTLGRRRSKAPCTRRKWTATERPAILDVLHEAAERFRVNNLQVHNGWAWIDTTPLDKRGRAIAEGGPLLLHLENNGWQVIDLSTISEDPNNLLGAEDVSRVYLANLRKTFSGVPLDICPKPRF